MKPVSANDVELVHKASMRLLAQIDEMLAGLDGPFARGILCIHLRTELERRIKLATDEQVAEWMAETKP